MTAIYTVYVLGQRNSVRLQTTSRTLAERECVVYARDIGKIVAVRIDDGEAYMSAKPDGSVFV